MKDFKKHIALFLLAYFMLPQIATSLHYVLKEHHSSGKSTLYSTAAKEIGHTCEYQLTSLFYAFDNLVYAKAKIGITNLGEQGYCSLENYVYALAFNFRLRGPPALSFI